MLPLTLKNFILTLNEHEKVKIGVFPVTKYNGCIFESGDKYTAFIGRVIDLINDEELFKKLEWFEVFKVQTSSIFEHTLEPTAPSADFASAEDCKPELYIELLDVKKE